MNPIAIFGCRAFQTAFCMALPFLPYREPAILHSCSELGTVFQKEHTKSVLIVTDRGIVESGLTARVEEAVRNSGVSYAVYDKTQPNPTVDNVEEALKLYREIQADTLIAVGGGSSMDCAKALGTRAAYPRRTVNQMGGILRVLRRLPILTYDSFDDLIRELKEREKPLALYLFSSDRSHMQRVTTEVSYGGGCINDMAIHLATSEMGFGGVGESGMGSYHGKAGFEAFSHEKSIVDKKTWLDMPMRYQPYESKLYEKLLHLFLR